MKKSDLNTIHGRLRNLRQEQGLTQQGFADEVNAVAKKKGLKEWEVMSRAGVNAVECGRYNPSLNLILLIQETFKVSFDWLLGGNEPAGKGSKELLDKIAMLEKLNSSLERQVEMLEYRIKKG